MEQSIKCTSVEIIDAIQFTNFREIELFIQKHYGKSIYHGNTEAIFNDRIRVFNTDGKISILVKGDYLLVNSDRSLTVMDKDTFEKYFHKNGVDVLM